jgi:uncharacterized oligopeptide transporter (OPT) family protein
VLSVGIDALHPTARMAALIGLVVGTVLTVLERFASPRLRAFIPAPSGLGIGCVIPGSNAIMMFLGATFATAFRRQLGKRADDFIVPISSGFIAGESLMGILIALLAATGMLSG